MTFLLSVALKGALVLTVAFGLLALLRGAPAALRHGIWTAAFAALLVLPLLDAFGPAIQLPVLPADGSADRIERLAEADVVITTLSPGHVPHQVRVLRESRTHAAPAVYDVHVHDARVPVAAPHVGVGRVQHRSGFEWPASVPPAVLLLGLWAFGALVVLTRWVAAYASAGFMVRGATPVTDDDWLDAAERARRLVGLDGEVRLLVSDHLDVPVAWGWGTPAIVLPADAGGWDEERRDAVLLHELAHVRRADARTQVMAQLALALHWPNALAWLAYRRFLVEREHACDDAVLSGGATPSAYAGHLVEIARGVAREPHALTAFAPMARRSDLEHRVVSILDAGRRRVAASRSTLVRAVVLGLCIAAPLGVLRPVAAAAGDALTAEAPDDISEIEDMDSPLFSVPDAADMDAAIEEMANDATVMDALIGIADGDDIAEALQDTIPLARDVLGPARETTLAQVRRMRAEGRGLDDEAWDEIEREVDEAFNEAHIDYDNIVRDAIAQATADGHGTLYGATGWQQGNSQSDAERQEALREAADERRDARRQASRARERALRDADRDRDRALRDAERARREAQHEAEHARQEALRDGQRAREEALREADRARRRGLRDANRARSRTSATSRPGSGYAYSVGADGVAVSFSTSPGVGAWMAQLDEMDDAIRGIEQAAEDLKRREKASPGVMAGLVGGLAGIEGVVESIASADSWARSETERGIARTRIDATRSRLRAARRHVEACEND